jgi:hypothetical protein
MATTTVYAKFAAAFPANTNEATLLTSAAADAYMCFISVTNQDTVARTFNVAILNTTGSAASADWVAYLHPIEAGGTVVRKVIFGQGQSINIQASVASKLSFVLYGMKISTTV